MRERLVQVPMSDVTISSITQGELLHGVAKKPDAKHLPLVAKEFLLRVDILPWDPKAAEAYAQIRSICENERTPLGAMDMMIAAHSIAVDAVPGYKRSAVLSG